MSVENPHKIDTAKLDEIIQSYDCKKSNLIAILQKVQEVYRYLPEEAMIYIGTKIEGLSPAIFFYVLIKIPAEVFAVICKKNIDVLRLFVIIY